MSSSPQEQNAGAMLAGATLFAMTRFVEAPCVELANMVARHLECVADDEQGDPRLRDVCNALAMRWRGWIVANVAMKTQGNAH